MTFPWHDGSDFSPVLNPLDEPSNTPLDPTVFSALEDAELTDDEIDQLLNGDLTPLGLTSALWSKKDRDEDVKFIAKPIPASSTLLDLFGKSPGKIGNIVGVTKNGKTRLRMGHGTSSYIEELKDGEWRKKAKVHLVSYPDSPEGKKMQLMEPESPTHAEWSKPSRDSHIAARFDDTASNDTVSATTLTNTSSDLTTQERDRLEAYRNVGYSGINQGLRLHPEKYAARMDNGIDTVMDRSSLQRDVVTHRGIKKGASVFGSAWSPEPGSLIGLEYVDHGYSSTSTSKEISRQFADEETGAIVNILSPKGTNAVSFDSEGEILLDRSLKFRIIDDYMADGIRNLDVEVVK